MPARLRTATQWPKLRARVCVITFTCKKEGEMETGWERGNEREREGGVGVGGYGGYGVRTKDNKQRTVP